MVWNIVFLIIGLVLILAGANALTDGASAIARRFGISDLVIGLTIVAFGTSAPELAISVISAAKGSAGLAIGNVVGSNIFNICAIIGIVALVRPIVMERGILINEIPLVILSSIALLVIGNGVLLNGSRISEVSRTDGILLLLFFAIFLRYTFSQAKKGVPGNSVANTDPETGNAGGVEVGMPMWKAILWVVGGLAALIYGGDRFVAGASGIALGLGVSESVVGLTIVAAGTSLPELAASVTAALKGKPGIAVGNVIGSNIFNIFLVLGAAAVIRPLPFGSIGNVDLLTLVGASLLFWLFGWKIKERTITRGEGVVLVLIYVGYIAWQVVNA